MTSQSQGIHQLLQAEKRAKDKLDEAKKRKGKRSKQAKEEATAEIEQYRMQKEKEFRFKQSKIIAISEEKRMVANMVRLVQSTRRIML
ncbi:V-type proton ATPase subunit G 3 [Echinops telfairi]|uniref:V-type proton ATPase subunit G n=1 Tax=Echinops telfairi TaxID=9371 RepID=A0ABM0IHG3_ECHTE|nr:V-type proton ATPase subunit G 3 [Echinops telfairi]